MSDELNKIVDTKYLDTNVDPLPPAEQRLFLSSPSFTCGGSVTSWSVGVVRGQAEEDEECPELQIWDPLGMGAFQRRSSTSVCRDNLKKTRHNHVYRVVPTDTVKFQAGDYLGTFQPPNSMTKLNYVKSDQMNIIISSDTSMTTLALDDYTVFLQCESKASKCSTPLVTVRVGECVHLYT